MVRVEFDIVVIALLEPIHYLFTLLLHIVFPRAISAHIDEGLISQCRIILPRFPKYSILFHATIPVASLH